MADRLRDRLRKLFTRVFAARTVVTLNGRRPKDGEAERLELMAEATAERTFAAADRLLRTFEKVPPVSESDKASREAIANAVTNLKRAFGEGLEEGGCAR